MYYQTCQVNEMNYQLVPVNEMCYQTCQVNEMYYAFLVSQKSQKSNDYRSTLSWSITFSLQQTSPEKYGKIAPGGGYSIKGFLPFGKACRQQLFTTFGVSLNQSRVVKP